MKKNSYIYVGLGLAVLLIGVLVWYFFFKAKPATQAAALPPVAKVQKQILQPQPVAQPQNAIQAPNLNSMLAPIVQNVENQAVDYAASAIGDLFSSDGE